MSLRKQVSAARVGNPDGIHKLIDLSKLKLKSVTYNDLEKTKAIRKCLNEECKRNETAGFFINFNKGAVRLLKLSTAQISPTHPQVVEMIGETGYGVMCSHIAV